MVLCMQHCLSFLSLSFCYWQCSQRETDRSSACPDGFPDLQVSSFFLTRSTGSRPKHRQSNHLTCKSLNHIESLHHLKASERQDYNPYTCELQSPARTSSANALTSLCHGCNHNHHMYIDTNLNKTVNSDAAANAKQTNVDILYAHLYPISHTIKLVPLRTSTPSKSGQQQTGFFSADGVTPLGSVYWRGVLRLSSSLRAFRNLSQWHQRTLGFDPWQHRRIMTLAGNSEKMWNDWNDAKKCDQHAGNFPQASTKTLRIIRIASQLTCPSS